MTLLEFLTIPLIIIGLALVLLMIASLILP